MHRLFDPMSHQWRPLHSPVLLKKPSRTRAQYVGPNRSNLWKKMMVCVCLCQLLCVPASGFSLPPSSSAYVHPSALTTHEIAKPHQQSSLSILYKTPHSIQGRQKRRNISRTQLNAVLMPAIPTSYFYLAALAVQFGVQPLLTKTFTPQGIIRSTVIIGQDFLRLSACFLMLWCSGNWSTAIQGWTWQSSLAAAGIPSLLYMVQNYFALVAYQLLPPVTFNILNQTKTLSAAFCCYLILGRRQSPLQIVALLLLLLSALVIEKIIPLPGAQKGKIPDVPDFSANTESEEGGSPFAAGVIPILIASFISGLAGAVSQKNLQVAGRDVLIFSMELSVISLVTMISTLILGSPDGKELRRSGIAKGWTWKTWIPVLTNAAGGVIVGMVTKHSGAVRKGFGLIFGLLLSGILQNKFLSDEGITTEQVYGGILASISVWMHSRFPPSIF